MKISKIISKTAIFSLVLALLLVNVASSSTPSVNPPGSELSPTFSNVNVKNEIRLNDVNDLVPKTLITPTIVRTDNVIVTILKGIASFAEISFSNTGIVINAGANGHTSFLKDVLLYDDMNIQGKIKNSGTSPLQIPVIVDDGLEVTGKLNVKKISSSQDLDFTPANDLHIGGEIQTNGSKTDIVSITKAILMMAKNNLNLSSGGLASLSAKSSLNLSGDQDIKLDTNGDIRIMSSPNGTWDSGIYITSDSVDIVGTKLTADSIGTYFVRKLSDGKIEIGSGGYTAKWVGCDEKEVLISCGLEGYSKDSKGKFVDSSAVSLQGTRITTPINQNKCRVAAHNPYEEVRYFEPYAYCFNPGL